MDLNEDICAEILSIIEGNDDFRFYLHSIMIPKEDQLEKLSYKRTLQLEALTGVIIEFKLVSLDIPLAKIRTLEMFLKTHQWVHIDFDHPFHALIMWFKAYKQYIEIADGQRLVIHTNGELEVVDEDEYFSQEEEAVNEEEEILNNEEEQEVE